MTAIQTETHRTVSRDEWLTARKALLQREKELTYLREELAQARRQLPRVRVDKDYTFDSTKGPVRLADLFDSRSQLIVYHFMFHPDWVEGCKSCSYVADHFDGMLPHLAGRDTGFVAISRARLEHLTAFRRRMGWKFEWVSSFANDFNFGYHVSFTPELLATGEASYNFESLPREAPAGMPLELPGASVFYKEGDGAVYHTYSTYARGLDALIGTYQWLDLAPKGRDEAGLKHTMNGCGTTTATTRATGWTQRPGTSSRRRDTSVVNKSRVASHKARCHPERSEGSLKARCWNPEGSFGRYAPSG